jgi:hypothetical protein
MARYSDIKGFTVQTVSSDPASGQFAAGTWAVDAYCPLQTQNGGSFGITTAAVTTGGYDGSAYVQTTVEFNGTSWSAGGSMTRPAGQSFPGFGTEPSGGIAGGYKTSGNAVVNNFESYNGSSFSEETDLNNARQAAGATGASSTAGIVVGGTTGVASPPDVTGNNNVEIWNGSAWTEIAEINTARYNLKALGATCPAPTAVVAGGENSGNKNTAVEQYNGSSWTEVEDLNTARSAGQGAGTTTSSGIYFGGEGPASGGYVVYAQTENWNGSSWTEVNDMVTARYMMSLGTGSSSSAIVTGGRNPGYNGLTEIWSAPSTFQTITQGQLFYNSTANAFKETITDLAGAAWSSGGNLNTAREAATGDGTQTAAFMAGGRDSSNPVALHEQYNGTAWSEAADLNTARRYLGNAGTTTAGLAMGSNVPASWSNVESWNGSAWTETAELNTGRGYMFRAGATGTAVIIAGGYTTTHLSVSESWNGSAWTEVNDLNTAKGTGSGGGTYTSAILGSAQAPGGYTNSSESWDGTNWTEVSEINTTRGFGGGSGTSNISGIVFGGATPPPASVANTETWDGSSWTERADLATPTNNGVGGAGTRSAALCFGGNNPPPGQIANTEEFTANLANKTITSS